MRKYKNATNHSKENHSLYGIWNHMNNRCFDDSCSRYKDYGGRGVSVCQEWHEDFDAFADWAKDNGYAFGLTIDRIDNNGNYEPSNCRWVTKREQNRNKRTNLMVTYRGETKTLTDWCEQLGLTYDSVHNRIVKGWPVEEAFNTPMFNPEESLSALCRKHGINVATVRDRINKFGWNLEEALTTPCHGRGKMPRDLSNGYFGEAKCRVCGKTFTKHNSKMIYCGERCRAISKQKSFKNWGCAQNV